MEQCRLMRVEANNATNDALEAQEMYRDDRDNVSVSRNELVVS